MGKAIMGKSPDLCGGCATKPRRDLLESCRARCQRYPRQDNYTTGGA